MLREAEVIQKSIENNRKLPKKYLINNPLVDCEYSYQTKLASMDDATAKDILKKPVSPVVKDFSVWFRVRI